MLAIVAFLTLGLAFRERMDAWSWSALLVLEVGLIAGLVPIARSGRAYQSTPTGAVMLVPADQAPIGMAATAVMWVGLGFYGLAARGAKALPANVGWIFVVAAIIGLLAIFVNVLVITPYWWVIAMLVLTFGVASAAASLMPAPRPAPSETVTA